MEYMMQRLCGMQHNATIDRNVDKKDDDMIRAMKIYPVLWRRFNEFREYPNLKQRVKFDTISDHLKRFFMQKDTTEDEWRISFEEITNVYPNVKELHFINEYRFSDEVLSDLIRHIRSKGKQNTIEKISFLYYNYKHPEGKGKPSNKNIFQDPDTLREDLRKDLENLHWKIKCN
eukprot:796161_1